MRAYNAVEAELLREARLLAQEMIAYDRWIAVARGSGQAKLVAELEEERELTALRRGDVMRELWVGREVALA